MVPGQLPAGSIDAHVHIYGPFDRFPPNQSGQFAPTEQFPVEALFETWRGLGISCGVIVHALMAGAGNEVTLDALRRFPDRLRGVAILAADVDDRRLDALTDAGFRACRVNLMTPTGKGTMPGNTSVEDLERLAPRLRERGWHAEICLEAADLPGVADQLEALGMTIVVDHMGWTMTDRGVDEPGFRDLCARLRSGPYWCKLSGADRSTRGGAPYRDVEPFLRALVAANADRVVWGSDWPHPGHTPATMPREADLVDLLLRCVPDAGLRARILVDNPARLYGF